MMQESKTLMKKADLQTLHSPGTYGLWNNHYKVMDYKVPFLLSLIFNHYFLMNELMLLKSSIILEKGLDCSCIIRIIFCMHN